MHRIKIYWRKCNASARSFVSSLSLSLLALLANDLSVNCLCNVLFSSKQCVFISVWIWHTGKKESKKCRELKNAVNVLHGLPMALQLLLLLFPSRLFRYKAGGDDYLTDIIWEAIFRIWKDDDEHILQRGHIAWCGWASSVLSRILQKWYAQGSSCFIHTVRQKQLFSICDFRNNETLTHTHTVTPKMKKNRLLYWLHLIYSYYY